ncbi:MAG: urea ABC transporter permease subunit UrtC [Candidatus Scalindua sediminis]|nr:urea ABC transporter permease subunit UrtC [Candidatus Scalindua sediminis]
MANTNHEKKWSHPALTGSRVKEWSITGGVLFAFLIGIPLLSALPSDDAWYKISNFRLNLLGKFLSFAIVAVGLNLAWGYTGILSLGQGVYFGLGAYIMGMYLLLKVGVAGHYESVLPDFMVWNGLTEMPLFWRPMYYAAVALPLVIIVPVVASIGLGYLTFKSRVRGVYFAIVTQATAMILMLTLIGNQPYTGGTNGLNDFRTIFGMPLRGPDLPKTEFKLYLATVVILFGAYVLSRWIVRSKLGRVLTAIRDDEQRVRFTGYDVANFKIFIFAVAAAFAGIGGACFVPQVGIIAPANVGIVPSIEMTLWVAVGGRGTLVGPVIGAILVNSCKSGFSELYPGSWLYFLGALFLGVVVLFPQGVAGIARFFRRSRVGEKTLAETTVTTDGGKKINKFFSKLTLKKHKGKTKGS